MPRRGLSTNCHTWLGFGDARGAMDARGEAPSCREHAPHAAASVYNLGARFLHVVDVVTSTRGERDDARLRRRRRRPVVDDRGHRRGPRAAHRRLFFCEIFAEKAVGRPTPRVDVELYQKREAAPSVPTQRESSYVTLSTSESGLSEVYFPSPPCTSGLNVLPKAPDLRTAYV